MRVGGGWAGVGVGGYLIGPVVQPPLSLPTPVGLTVPPCTQLLLYVCDLDRHFHNSFPVRMGNGYVPSVCTTRTVSYCGISAV